MWIIGTIVIGFVVGLLARAIIPGSDRAGFIVTTLLGIGGAVIGTFAGQMIGLYRPGQTTGFIGALLGAMLLLFLHRMLVRERSGGAAPPTTKT